MLRQNTFSDNAWFGLLIICSLLALAVGYGARQDEVERKTTQVSKYKEVNNSLSDQIKILKETNAELLGKKDKLPYLTDRMQIRGK